MALPLVLLVALTLMCLVYSAYKKLRYHLPPGPRPWPVVGNLYQIKPVRFRCFDEWSKSYGPIMSVWFGSSLNVVVSSAELAKQVLKEKDQQLADRYRNRRRAQSTRDGSDLIWADYGPHYVKVRKLCTLELFTAKRIEALRPIREDEVTAMVESIYNATTNPDPNMGKDGLVMRKYLGAVAYNIITRLVLGKRFVNAMGVMDEQGVEFKAITTEGRKFGASLGMVENIPWLRWMFPVEVEALAKHLARRKRLAQSVIEEHRLARQNSDGHAKQHFVDALFTLRDQYELSNDTVIGLLWDMIVAGMDTIAITVEWAMAELIKNPRVQQKAQEELDRVIGPDRLMTELDFSNLPYLQCLAKEALRLHPPTPLMLPHRANADVKVGGYDIPKDSVMNVNVWAIARDPAVWKSPLEFLPERFLEEDVDMKGHDFRLLPFGAGRRVCPGAQIAINIVTSMLGHLLHHFSWAPLNGLKPEEIDMEETPGLVTYMRTPVRAIPTPRLAAHLYKRVAVGMSMRESDSL